MKGVFIGYDSLDIVVGVDPDAYWKDFRNWEAAERATAIATNGLHWRAILDGIDLPQRTKTKFWSAFVADAALVNRKRALFGLVLARREEEINLIERTREVMNLYDGAVGKILGRYQDGDLKEIVRTIKYWEPSLASIGSEFAKLIRDKNFRALRNIADLLEHGVEVGAESMECSKNSPDGKILRAFVNFHTRNRGLPTKGELRVESGLTNGREEEKAASKSISKLGFSGLP